MKRSSTLSCCRHVICNPMETSGRKHSKAAFVTVHERNSRLPGILCRSRKTSRHNIKTWVYFFNLVFYIKTFSGQFGRHCHWFRKNVLAYSWDFLKNSHDLKMSIYLRFFFASCLILCFTPRKWFTENWCFYIISNPMQSIMHEINKNVIMKRIYYKEQQQ